jgi:ubiquinone/menaquinone biosynthesis C-methylase UbiE
MEPQGGVEMKLRYVAMGGLGLAAASYLSRRIRRAPRTVRIGVEEDPAVVQAYLRVSEMPQFRMMRGIVARRAVEGLWKGRALDLGSGSGRLALAIAEESPGMAVIGLDLSQEMVETASGNARESGLADRVTFVKGSVDKVPYPEASFDVVVSTLSLHHWPNPTAVFDEVGRILRPGGRFLIVDLRRDVGLAAWTVLWLATHVVAPLSLRQVNEPLASRESAFTPEELVEMLSRSTLQNWEVTSGPLWIAVQSTNQGQA